MNSGELNALLFGAAVGVVVSTLLTPRPGREYRGRIHGKVKDAERAVREKASEAKQQIERKHCQISDALEAGRQAYQRAQQTGTVAPTT
ncbi:MAG: YtxH domain-containing protein [Bryobacteraceae bacterium]